MSIERRGASLGSWAERLGHLMEGELVPSQRVASIPIIHVSLFFVKPMYMCGMCMRVSHTHVSGFLQGVVDLDSGFYAYKANSLTHWIVTIDSTLYFWAILISKEQILHVSKICLLKEYNGVIVFIARWLWRCEADKILLSVWALSRSFLI